MEPVSLWGLLINPISNVVDTVLKRVLPAEKMSEAEKAQASMAIQQEIFREVFTMYGKEVEDMASARALAQVEAANSVWFAKFLAGIFRPITGFAFLGLYLWAKLSGQFGLPPINLASEDYYLFGGIMAFYFGLRHREKTNGAT